MHSPSALATLARKEWRALWAAPGWWVLLGAIGPLVGVSFARAVAIFAEASAGAATGGGEAFSPLDGVWAPTFSAYEVAAVFLLPFVAIRVMSADRQSGALKIELQRRVPPLTRAAAKAGVLLAAWVITGGAGAIALALWRSYGGHIYWPEVGAVVLGHVLNGAMTIALAMTAAAIADHPATAAVVTLGVTVGTWVVAFAGIMQGGLWERVAGSTPTAMVAVFQHGLVRADLVIAALTLAAAGVGLAAVWTPLGRSAGQRARGVALVATGAVALLAAASAIHASADLSENRRSSFAEVDEAALAAWPHPLRITVHLAPEDPRRVDFERRALIKLRRARPDVTITYIARTTIGMWEQTDGGYGEIWYETNGHRVLSRATTAEGALEAIYEAAGLTPPVDDELPYTGHPLQARPTGARVALIAGWPAAVAAGLWVKRRRR